MNEKGQRALPHVFWDAFPNQKVAYQFLRQQDLHFSGSSSDALRSLLDRYGVEKLGSMVAEQIKSRLYPDDLNELWKQYWAEELPTMDAVLKADPDGYLSWVDVDFSADQRTVKDWSRFAHFYFQYLGDQPPVVRKRAIE